MDGSSWVDGTVTSLDPLRVQLDGDTSPLPFAPDSLVDPSALAVDDRVRCELAGNGLIVHGRAGGTRLMRLSFATKTALDAFTGWPGLVGFVEAENSEYLWISGAWKLWSAARTAYTPSLSGVTLGTGSAAFDYWVVAGRYFVDGKITLGVGGGVTGEIVVGAPAAMDGSVNDLRGAGSFYDNGVAVYPGTVIQHSVNTAVRLRVLSPATTWGSLAAASSTVPFSHGNGDSYHLWFEFWAA